MKTETELETLEREMKQLNLDFIPKNEIPEEQYLSVEVDVDVDFTLHKIQDQVARRKCHRGTIYFVTFEENERKYLTMKVGCKVPKDFADIYLQSFKQQTKLTVRANTYPDLCWLHSEGTKNTDLPQVETEPRAESILGDLTTVLPSKFIDDFAEMMHVLNQGMISGILEDGIVYGPFLFSKEQFLSKLKYSSDGELI